MLAPAAAAPSTLVSAGSLSDELEIVRGARQALPSNPERALAATAEHEVRYRSGVFSEEREAIAIEALVKLGRRNAAEQRAEAFHRAFPHSAYQRRIGLLLAPL